MRTVLPGGAGICRTCKTFIDGDYAQCFQCNRRPNLFQEVVPITYSEEYGQMHTALRNYKENFPASVKSYALNRIGAILWRFLDAHEDCVARAANVSGFDLVTTVPSSTPANDDARGNFRAIAEWCRPIADRYERVLRATGNVEPGRDVSFERYTSTRPLGGAHVLLLDDTWVSGGHAQSAAAALTQAGAGRIAAVVVGRHVQSSWMIDGKPSSEVLAELPTAFDWTTCAAHDV